MIDLYVSTDNPLYIDDLVFYIIRFLNDNESLKLLRCRKITIKKQYKFEFKSIYLLDIIHSKYIPYVTSISRNTIPNFKYLTKITFSYGFNQPLITENGTSILPQSLTSIQFGGAFTQPLRTKDGTNILSLVEIIWDI